MRTSLFWSGLCLLAGAAVPADEAPPSRFARAIETAPRTDEELIAVPLDSEVFAIAQPELGELRILDGEGNEVGYLLRTAPATQRVQVERFWTPRPPTLRRLEGEGLEITLTLEDRDPRPSGLRLVTPLDNFEQHIQVFSSRDGGTWQPLTEGLLFDYTRYMDVRNDRLPLPPTEHRRLRIVIQHVTAAQESELLELTRRLSGDQPAESIERVQIERRPFRIDRLELWAEQVETTTPRITEYPLAGVQTEIDATKKLTQVLIESRQQPLTSFTLETPDRNFSRRVRIECEVASGSSQRWQTLGEGAFTSLDFQSLYKHELTIRFAETRATRYRLTITNRDSPPLTIAGVTAAGPVRQAVFLAAPDGEYRLAYGGDVDRATYDTAAIQAALKDRTTPVEATLAARVEPLALPPLAPEPPWKLWVNNPWLLTALILVLAATLGWTLYQAAQRVDQLPREDDAAR